jgi:transcriptional regulator with XRE-family HTH domain
MLGINSSDFATIFGQVLRRARKNAGFSQEQLGFEADLQRNYISLMELGRYQPTVGTMFKLAIALKLKPTELVALIENALTQQAESIEK